MDPIPEVCEETPFKSKGDKFDSLIREIEKEDYINEIEEEKRFDF